MQVDDSSASELPAEPRGQDSHVASEDDIVDIVLVDDLGETLVVGVAGGVANALPGDAELLGNPPTSVAVADHDGGMSADSAVADRSKQRGRCLWAEGRANGEPGRPGVLIARPSPDGEPFLSSNLIHRLTQAGNRSG